MDWSDLCRDLDAYLDDLPEPTDEELRAIEAEGDPVLPTDEELAEWLEMLLDTD